MKHSISLFSAMSLSVLGVFAQTPAAADDESLLFGYCGDYAISLGSSDPDIKVEKGAIEIPADLASSWEGAYITKVNIGYGVSSVKDVTVFFTENLDGEPFYSQKATMTKERGWNLVSLDQPLEVEGKRFYVGYSTSVNSPADKPIGLDNIKNSDPYCAFVNTYDEWESVGRFYGSLCLRLSLIGDNLPQYSVVASGLMIPGLVERNSPFAAEFYVENQGLKTVNSLEVEYAINGETIDNGLNIALDTPLASGETALIRIPDLRCGISGKDLDFELSVTKVNGFEDESPLDNGLTSIFSCAGKTYRQQVVVEEFTGTWCGWCPLGIVGMEYMKEKYGDAGFNGIAVHNGDPMQVESYVEFANIVTGGSYPSAYFNRSLFFLEPSKETLEQLYLEAIKTPSAAGVDVSAVYSPDEMTIEVVSNVEFSFDEEDAAYAMAYVIIEDNVGPYVQTNYFSGGAYGDMDGWGDKPEKVTFMYNEVARLIEETYGIPGSVPAAVSAGTTYKWEASLSCLDVYDIKECEVIALLLNTTTGEVVNSAKTIINDAEAGIGSLDAESNDKVIRVYNLQGVKVLETEDSTKLNSLGKGLYIVNGKKILF